MRVRISDWRVSAVRAAEVGEHSRRFKKFRRTGGGDLLGRKPGKPKSVHTRVDLYVHFELYSV